MFSEIKMIRRFYDKQDNQYLSPKKNSKPNFKFILIYVHEQCQFSLTLLVINEVLKLVRSTYGYIDMNIGLDCWVEDHLTRTAGLLGFIPCPAIYFQYVFAHSSFPTTWSTGTDRKLR